MDTIDILHGKLVRCFLGSGMSFATFWVMIMWPSLNKYTVVKEWCLKNLMALQWCLTNSMALPLGIVKFSTVLRLPSPLYDLLIWLCRVSDRFFRAAQVTGIWCAISMWHTRRHSLLSLETDVILMIYNWETDHYFVPATKSIRNLSGSYSLIASQYLIVLLYEQHRRLAVVGDLLPPVDQVLVLSISSTKYTVYYIKCAFEMKWQREYYDFDNQ